MMDTVRILGKPWKIERVADAPMQNDRVGEAEYSLSLIRLKEGQSTEQEADTLLHEIIHAVDYTVDIGLEERQVHALAGGLCAVFWDNPALAERLGFTSES